MGGSQEWGVLVVGEYGSHVVPMPSEVEARAYVDDTKAMKAFRTRLVSRRIGAWEETT